MGSSIACSTQKHGMPKRQQTSKTQQQIEGARKQRKAHHFHEEDGINPNGCDYKEQHHDGKCHPLVSERLSFENGRCGVGHGHYF
jgi:hypothetical protein